MSGQGDDVILFNCMRDDQYVLIEGERTELPRAPRPVILEGHERSDDLHVRAARDGAASALRVDGGECDGTLSMPVQMPGAMYLVEPAMLLRHPHRDDLVTPSTYTIDFKGTRQSTLVSVRRHLPVVHPDAPNIDPNTDFDDADLDDANIDPDAYSDDELDDDAQGEAVG